MVERIPGPGPGAAISAPLPVRPAEPVERSVDPRLEAFQRTLATMLGSKVPVSVLARLADGGFMVRVAGTQAAMMLPAGTQPGVQLTMTVLAASPRPTFGLGEATLHGSPVASGAKVAAAASPPIGADARHTGADLGADASADLSPAARLLSQVLQGAAPGPATPIAGAAPLAPPRWRRRAPRTRRNWPGNCSRPSPKAACSMSRMSPSGRKASGRWPN